MVVSSNASIGPPVKHSVMAYTRRRVLAIVRWCVALTQHVMLELRCSAHVLIDKTPFTYHQEAEQGVRADRPHDCSWHGQRCVLELLAHVH